MTKDYLFWVEKLELLPHPEGGYFKETYRSKGVINKSALPSTFNGDRSYSTAIYFLLTSKNFSAFHKIASDELWHFYDGDGLSIHIIHPDGKKEELRLGRDIKKGETFQAMVPAGSWFASETINREGWALVGCTVAPGFDFNDFEMAERDKLIKKYPQHTELIQRLTRTS